MYRILKIKWQVGGMKKIIINSCPKMNDYGNLSGDYNCGEWRSKILGC